MLRASGHLHENDFFYFLFFNIDIITGKEKTFHENDLYNSCLSQLRCSDKLIHNVKYKFFFHVTLGTKIDFTIKTPPSAPQIPPHSGISGSH